MPVGGLVVYGGLVAPC